MKEERVGNAIYTSQTPRHKFVFAARACRKPYSDDSAQSSQDMSKTAARCRQNQHRVGVRRGFYPRAFRQTPNATSKSKDMRILIGIICFALLPNLSRAQHPYASDKPITEATVFGAGIISTGSFDSHPAFTPDGKTLYFLRSTPNFNLWTIVFSHFEGGRWNIPEVASFSGQYSDADPFITASSIGGDPTQFQQRGSICFSWKDD